MFEACRVGLYLATEEADVEQLVAALSSVAGGKYARRECFVADTSEYTSGITRKSVFVKRQRLAIIPQETTLLSFLRNANVYENVEERCFLYSESSVGSKRSRVFSEVTLNAEEVLLSNLGFKEDSVSNKIFSGVNIYFQSNLRVSLLRYAVKYSPFSQLYYLRLLACSVGRQCVCGRGCFLLLSRVRVRFGARTCERNSGAPLFHLQLLPLLMKLELCIIFILYAEMRLHMILSEYCGGNSLFSV